jgi:hypothetical protein
MALDYAAMMIRVAAELITPCSHQRPDNCDHVGSVVHQAINHGVHTSRIGSARASHNGPNPDSWPIEAWRNYAPTVWDYAGEWCAFARCERCDFHHGDLLQGKRAPAGGLDPTRACGEVRHDAGHVSAGAA